MSENCRPRHQGRWLVQGWLPFGSYLIGLVIFGALQKQPWQAAPGWVGWLPEVALLVLGIHIIYCMMRWDLG